MTTCSCPAVVDVTIMRPDLKFQLGFSVKEGNVRREREQKERDRREKRERQKERETERGREWLPKHLSFSSSSSSLPLSQICSLWRGSIAERSGIRVGHRIIEINGTSTVGISHEEIVHMLSTTVGDVSAQRIIDPLHCIKITLCLPCCRDRVVYLREERAPLLRAAPLVFA